VGAKRSYKKTRVRGECAADGDARIVPASRSLCAAIISPFADASVVLLRDCRCCEGHPGRLSLARSRRVRREEAVTNRGAVVDT
jgi:hypothetical protein